MSRKFKGLGVALLAAVALSATAASSAQGAFNTHHITVPSAPAFITATSETGEATPVVKITTAGMSFACATAKLDATVAEKTNTAITVTPTYSECFVEFGSVHIPLLPDVNHCGYILKGSTDVNGDAGFEVECSGETENEITFRYTLLGSECVIHFSTAGQYKGVHYTQTEDPATSKKDITINATVSGLKYHETSKGFCPEGRTGEDGTLVGGFTATAYKHTTGAGCQQAAEGTERTTPPSNAKTEECEGEAIDLELNENMTEP